MVKEKLPKKNYDSLVLNIKTTFFFLLNKSSIGGECCSSYPQKRAATYFFGFITPVNVRPLNVPVFATDMPRLFLEGSRNREIKLDPLHLFDLVCFFKVANPVPLKEKLCSENV